MKRTLQEELERIHQITYGEKIVNEGIIDTILQKVGLKKDGEGKKVDDPKKADFVSDDVKQFFDTLENIKSEVKQQSSGNYQYQKDVETIQIGLKILGYDLPKHGIDGKYGPETAAAVQKFKSDNNLNKESQPVSESILISILEQFEIMKEAVELVQLDDTSYSNVKFDTDGTQYDEVNKALLDDLQKAASAAGVVATITTAKTGHGFFTKSGRKSRHMSKTAVDIAILDGQGAKGASNPNNGNPQFREKGDRLKDALVELGYTWNTESGNPKAVLWQTNTGGNHFNHLHVSNNSGASTAELDAMSLSGGGSTMTLDDIKVFVEKLKQKGVTPEELKTHIDSIVQVGGGPIEVTGTWLDITKELLRKHEGFQATAKWDENAYRGGYGSDKKLVDGRLVDATSDTTWTKQEAEETMEYEIKNYYAPTVVKQLGNGNWNKLTDPQKAALVSLGYNAGPYFLTAREYGRKIKSAIESGDMAAAAAAIEQGPTTGAGSGKVYAGLQRRRKEEAQIFMA